MTDDLTIRPATENDRDAAVELLTAAHGTIVRDATSWDWLFKGRVDRYMVADTGERLAAQYALLPVRVRHGDSVIDASLSLDTATHPDFGGRGLMTRLGRAAYDRSGSELVFGFPNARSAGVFYNRLGWRETAPFPLWVKPLPGLVRALTGLPLPPVGRRRRGASVERFDRFGAWADEIWDASAGRGETAVVRDSTYLNWRFVDAPFDYQRFVAPAGPEPVAHAVIRTVPWRHGRLTYLMELAAFPGAEADAARVLRAALGEARGSAGVVAVATPSDPLLPVLTHAGFRHAPARARAGFSFGARRTGALADDAGLERIESWHLTAGDFDHI